MDAKYLILDMGKVLVGPTTGYWLITPSFLENVDMNKIDKIKLKDAMEEFNYILGKKMLTLDEEFFYMMEYYKSVLDRVNYSITDEKLKNIVNDFVYFNGSDSKYYLYNDVKSELKRLSEKYTLLMLSDNWPCGEEYLKKHEIYEYFDKIYISSTYGYLKSDKVFFDFLINDYNIKKGEVIYVDDSEELLDIGFQKGFDVRLMDRERQISGSKYLVINGLDEL